MTDEPKSRWGWIVTGIAGLLAIMGAVGLSLPQIATKDEIKAHAGEDKAAYERLAGDLKNLRRQVYNQQIESYELRLIRLQEAAERRKREGQAEGPLGQEVRILKRRTRAIQLKLDKLDKE